MKLRIFLEKDKALGLFVWLFVFCGTLLLTVLLVTEARKPILNFYLSGAFSPNGDSIKDRAVLKFKSGIPGVMTLRILRKGKTIFQERSSSGASIEWDGTDKGLSLEDGRYTASVVFKSEEGERQIKRTIVKDTKAPELRVEPRRAEKLTELKSKSIAFYLSEPCRVEMWIYRVNVESLWPVRMVGPKPFKAGSNEMTWDLKNTKKRYVDNGNYIVSFSARDLAGNGTGIDCAKVRRVAQLRTIGIRELLLTR